MQARLRCWRGPAGTPAGAQHSKGKHSTGRHAVAYQVTHTLPVPMQAIMAPSHCMPQDPYLLISSEKWGTRSLVQHAKEEESVRLPIICRCHIQSRRTLKMQSAPAAPVPDTTVSILKQAVESLPSNVSALGYRPEVGCRGGGSGDGAAQRGSYPRARLRCTRGPAAPWRARKTPLGAQQRTGREGNVVRTLEQ